MKKEARAKREAKRNKAKDKAQGGIKDQYIKTYIPGFDDLLREGILEVLRVV